MSLNGVLFPPSVRGNDILIPAAGLKLVDIKGFSNSFRVERTQGQGALSGSEILAPDILAQNKYYYITGLFAAAVRDANTKDGSITLVISDGVNDIDVPPQSNSEIEIANNNIFASNINGSNFTTTKIVFNWAIEGASSAVVMYANIAFEGYIIEFAPITD